jgi:hypothetical protein
MGIPAEEPLQPLPSTGLINPMRSASVRASSQEELPLLDSPESDLMFVLAPVSVRVSVT